MKIVLVAITIHHNVAHKLLLKQINAFREQNGLSKQSSCISPMIKQKYTGNCSTVLGVADRVVFPETKFGAKYLKTCAASTNNYLNIYNET